MKAYLGDPDLKAAFVAEIEKHREQDRILQGTYGTPKGEWRGCAVACSLRSLDIIKGAKLGRTYSAHSRYESELGIPEWLALLEDRIFEGLSREDARTWPGKFATAIPVGADLEPVRHQFLAWLMRANLDRVQALAIDETLKTQVLDAIRGVLALHERPAESAAGSAAWIAAWIAAGSAASAAWSAAGSAARSAESATYRDQAEALLGLLAEAKP